MVRYVIRNACLSDIDALMRLASILDTFNLPNEKSEVAKLLSLSDASFEGKISKSENREYVFVMEDRVSQRIVGTSQIIAQHGTKHAPHVFFEVAHIEHYSNTIDRHFKHQVLRLGFNYDGPTEMGGLVLDPDYRGAKEKLGRQLSFVRFLFLAAST